MLELRWLSIDISVSTVTWRQTRWFQNFFGVLLYEKVWEISCQLARVWDRSWNHETHDKVMRLGKSEWKNQTNHSTWEWVPWLVCCFAYTMYLRLRECGFYWSYVHIIYVVVHGELEEMLTPLLLILQLHFHLWYLIFTRPQAPLRLTVYKNQPSAKSS